MDNFDRNIQHMKDLGHSPGFPFLVWFVELKQPKHATEDAAKSALLESFHNINDYDPMQFHGHKTVEELQTEVERQWNQVPNPYDYMFKEVLSYSTHNCTRETSEQVREEVEARPGFRNWILYPEITKQEGE